jgi:hypothetical protein
VDDSALQMLETWLWGRLSSWSDLFALAINCRNFASIDYVGVSSLYHTAKRSLHLVHQPILHLSILDEQTRNFFVDRDTYLGYAPLFFVSPTKSPAFEASCIRALATKVLEGLFESLYGSTSLYSIHIVNVSGSSRRT